MMEPLAIFLKGLGIGVAIAAPVGPVGVLCLRRSLAQGWVMGMVSGLGAATADALYGVAAALGASWISQLFLGHQSWLGLFGGGFICFLGLKTFLARPADQQERIGVADIVNAWVSTFFLTLTNPLTVIAFVTIFAGMGLGHATSHSGYLTALLVIGVFAGSVLWWAVLATLAGFARKGVNLRILVWINRGTGVLLVLMGMALLLRVIWEGFLGGSFNNGLLY